MKKIVVGFVLYVGIALLACEDSPELKIASPDIHSLRKVGEQIPFNIGMEWIELYRERNTANGRTDVLGIYGISETRLNELLGSVSNPVGVAFHYGKDFLGIQHIIVIPVDETLSLWTNIPGRIYVDANSGNTISQSTAQSWAAGYKNANPDAVWFHFFGEEIFDEINALPFFNSIDIQPGLSALDLSPQMLLVIWDESSNLLGRTSDQEPGACFDASNPCPPCAID